MKYLKPKDGVFYYHVIDFTYQIDKHKALLAVEQGMKSVERAIYPLRIESTDDILKAQITIEWDRDYDRHGRRKTSIAFAHYPWSRKAGQMIFNDKKDWDFDKIRRVVTHECGHVFSLPHNKDPESPMSPYRDDRPFEFTKKDRKNMAIFWRLERHQYFRKLLDWSYIVRLREEDRKHLAEVMELEDHSKWGLVKALYS